MSAPTHIGHLLLTPKDPHASLDPEQIRRLLRKAGFIGNRLPSGSNAFLAGERFLQLITFAGCSPHIELTPSGDNAGPFCHIKLRGPESSVHLLYGRNTRAPRCYACRKPIADWRRSLPAWEHNPDLRFACPHCAEEQTPLKLVWKQAAGFGRFFVQVVGVFPGEAVPVPALMLLLQHGSGRTWRFFYIQE